VIATEADHHEAFLFGKNGLVYMPGCPQVRQDDRTHGGVIEYCGRHRMEKIGELKLIAGPATARDCGRAGRGG
jgi:hypothetical protein